MTVVVEPVKQEKMPEAVEGIPERVTFEQYGEILTRFHAKFIEIALERGWEHPSALGRKITHEMPERRTSKPKPAKIDGNLTEKMFKPDGWVKFTERCEREYAARLGLFRKRLLTFAYEGQMSLDDANAILTAAGLPVFPGPEGIRYRVADWPPFIFRDKNPDAAQVTKEFHRKLQVFLDENGMEMRPGGYRLPYALKFDDRPEIPEDQMAPLL